MMNENVVKVLKESMWDLATCKDGEPNVVPVAFKDVTDDGKLVVGDVFLETTIRNIQDNDGRIAISAYNANTLEGYQIKGRAEYVTSGPIVDTFKALVEKFGTDNLPAVAVFGDGTLKAAAEAGIPVLANAPTPEAPSMVKALDIYLQKVQNGEEILPVELAEDSHKEEFIRSQQHKLAKKSRPRRPSAETK